MPIIAALEERVSIVVKVVKYGLQIVGPVPWALLEFHSAGLEIFVGFPASYVSTTHVGFVPT
jgi:hypothetical protein